MKLIITLILAFLTLLFSIPSMSQCITGKGAMVSQSIQLEKINKIKLDSSVDVVFSKGDSQKITVKGQQNIIDELSTIVHDSEWAIAFNRSVCTYKELIVNITLPSLESITINGSGDVSSKSTFHQDEFALSINGSGDVDFSLEANQIDINVSGSGDVDLEGASKQMAVSINGSGDVSAYDLQVEDCDVVVSGSGDSKVNVSSKLTVSVSASGDVMYKGDPQSVQISESGSGDVIQR